MATESEIPEVTELRAHATLGGSDAIQITVRGATEAESIAIVQMLCSEVERIGGQISDRRGPAPWPSEAAASVTAGPAAAVSALIASEDFAFSMLMLRAVVARSAEMHLAEVEERRARDHARWLVQDGARQANRRARGIARMDAARAARMVARTS
ncbi:MAG: hypothetical protein HHJ14_02340 [Cellulomonas sp.]|nr:hypothetical protein [Cellulomonas sp.]